MDSGGLSSAEIPADFGHRETPYLLVPNKRIPSTWSACSSTEQPQEDDTQVKGQCTKSVTLEDFVFDPPRRSTTQSGARSPHHALHDLDSTAIQRCNSEFGVSVFSRASIPYCPSRLPQDAAGSPVRAESREGAAPEDALGRSVCRSSFPASTLADNREQDARETGSDAQICEPDDNRPRARGGYRGDQASAGSQIHDGDIVHLATEGTRTHGDGEATAEDHTRRHSGVLEASSEKDGACNAGDGTDATNVDGAGTRVHPSEYNIRGSCHSGVGDSTAQGAVPPVVPDSEYQTSTPSEALVAHHQDHPGDAVENKTEAPHHEQDKVTFHARHSDVMAEEVAQRQRSGVHAGAFRRCHTYDPSDFTVEDDVGKDAAPSIPASQVHLQNTTSVAAPATPGLENAQLNPGITAYMESDNDVGSLEKRDSVESADACEVHKMDSNSSVEPHQRQAALLHWKSSVASVMSRSSRGSTVSPTMRDSIDSIVSGADPPSFMMPNPRTGVSFSAISSRFGSIDMNDFVGNDFIGSYSSTAQHDTTQSRIDQNCMVTNVAADMYRGRYSKQSDADSRVGFIETINEGRPTMEKEYCSYGSSDCSVDCRPRGGRAHCRSSSSALDVPRFDVNASRTSDIVSNRTPSFQMDFTHDMTSGSVPMLESCRELVRATHGSRYLGRRPELYKLSVASTCRFGNTSPANSAQSCADPAFYDWRSSLEESVNEIQSLLVYFSEKQSSQSADLDSIVIVDSIFAHAEHLMSKIQDFPDAHRQTANAEDSGKMETTDKVNGVASSAPAERTEDYRSEGKQTRENADDEVARLRRELEEVKKDAWLVALQYEQELREANERLIGEVDGQDQGHANAHGRAMGGAALSAELAEVRATIARQQECLENEEERVASQEQQLIEKQWRIDNYEATARELRFEVKLRKNVETQLKQLHETDIASLHEAMTALQQDMTAQNQQRELEYGTSDESENKAAIRVLELEMAHLNMQLVSAKAEARTAARERDNVEMAHASDMLELQAHMDQERKQLEEQLFALKLEAEDRMTKEEKEEEAMKIRSAHTVEADGVEMAEPTRRNDDDTIAPADSALRHLQTLNAQLNEDNARLQREVTLCAEEITSLRETITDLGDLEGKYNADVQEFRGDVALQQNAMLAEMAKIHSERERALADTREALALRHRGSVRFHELETIHDEMKAQCAWHGLAPWVWDATEPDVWPQVTDKKLPCVVPSEEAVIIVSGISQNEVEKECSATQKEVEKGSSATQKEVENERITPQKEVENERITTQKKAEKGSSATQNEAENDWSGTQKELEKQSSATQNEVENDWSGTQKEVTSEASSEEAALKARFEELLMVCERQHRDIDMLCSASRRKIALQSVNVGMRRSCMRPSMTSGESNALLAVPRASEAKTAILAPREDECNAGWKAATGGGVGFLDASGARVQRSTSSCLLDQRSDEVTLWAQHFAESRVESERMRRLLDDTCASVEELLDVTEKAFAGWTTSHDVVELCKRVSRRVTKRVGEEGEDNKENAKPRDRLSSLTLKESKDIHAIRSRWILDGEKRKDKFAQQKARAMNVCETLENQVLAFVKERMDRRQAEGDLGAKVAEIAAQNSQIAPVDGEPLNSIVVIKPPPSFERSSSLPTRPPSLVRTLRILPSEEDQKQQGPNVASVSSLHSRLVNLRAALKPPSAQH